MDKYKYRDFLTSLRSGSQYGVFIDDTGSPGLQSSASNVHPERKTWVGVVIPPDQMPDVLKHFPGAVEELRRTVGAEEFHFADVYAGRGDFAKLGLQDRLELFELFSNIFSVYQYPVFVQTFDPNTLASVRGQADLPEKLGPFNLARQLDLALVFLLLRIKWHIERDRKDSESVARVFVDEGYKKNGIAISIPLWNNVFAGGLICFARSSSIYPIQLADFAAFALNRTQLLLGKSELSSLDRRLLEILSPIAWNYQNIEKRVIEIVDLEDGSCQYPLASRSKRIIER